MTRYRFAPSPTGHLHIGGARTALYNFLQAKRSGGKFVLRIEDTDRERSTQEYIDAILEAMKWLGLENDEGPYYQTQRMDLYQEYLQKLLHDGKAYRCFCSQEVLEEKRKAAMAEGRKPKYDGTCRRLNPTQANQDPRPHCLRFRAPQAGTTAIEDLIRGHIEFDNAELDDLILARTDGSPTYNFVVVVDDVTMKITHVIRGDDHLNNTPRQVLLYQALDFPIPIFAHIPMILGADKKRLSKRHGATSVLAYREEGYLPEALINYLVRLGWSHGDQEVFNLDQLIQSFDIKDVGKSAAVFNPEKLLWLNGLWIRQSTRTRLLETTLPFLKKMGIQITDSDYAHRALGSCQEKVKTLRELAEMSAFYFVDQVVIEEKARKKNLGEESLQTLRELVPLLEEQSAWDGASLETTLKSFGEEKGLKLGKIAGPLRVALTGTMVSPGIWDILTILGKEKVLVRIRQVLGG